MIAVLDLDAPIVPGEGLGGLRVGENIGSYDDLLFAGLAEFWDEPEESWKGRADVWGFELRYRFPELFDLTDEEEEHPPLGHDAVEITVDVRNGTVTRVCALEPYRGTLLDNIRTGMTYAEVRALAPSLGWSEVVVGQAIEGVEGVALYFVDREGVAHDGIPGEEKSDDRLEQICVFALDGNGAGSQ